MGLAPKGSKSSINKESNSTPKYAPNNPVDRKAKAALSKGSVAKGGTIKAPGEIVAMASPKTRNKAAATAQKRSK
ncbi:hypothetical protein UFOVP225_21 [uncultured Caudovirales phage]|uniref:Uncharacterized protein n=1 Tax=uncultured Caudovirales phage TaxID=2100421 RepID=A0A6J5L4R3_9CAUD|nr:hypothetical protein UFOVP113_34 [uncultured Caudovirales phage]CAB5219068.1 hypothetical protein UFOVP225_21 [uncultured Caudovirales phage]